MEKGNHMEQQEKIDRIEQLCPGVWAIDDALDDSLYVIEGKEKALVIDTGMSERNLMPVIRSITKKPLELLLTHAHIDHMYHADEFTYVYLHEADCKAWNYRLRVSMALGAKFLFHVRAKRYHVEHYHSIQEGEIIDLGDIRLRVLLVAGHTPGSVVVIDETHKLLFTGDAFGSGDQAWMWLPAGLSIGQYKQSLQHALITLRPYETYRFLGGHRRQGKPFAEHDHAHLLELQLVNDMYVLCDLMLQKKSTPVKVRVGPFKFYLYSYEKASMLIRKGKLKE